MIERQKRYGSELCVGRRTNWYQFARWCTRLVRPASSRFAKSLARENSRYNVNFNVVSPGPTDTPLLQEEIRDNPELIKRMTRLIPFRKVAQPEDQAAAVSFLVSDDASLHHRSGH